MWPPAKELEQTAWNRPLVGYLLGIATQRVSRRWILPSPPDTACAMSVMLKEAQRALLFEP